MQIKVNKTEGTGKTKGYASLTIEPQGEVSVKITVPQQETGAVKAYASMTVADATVGEVVITGMKVLESDKGLFVSMPNRKGNDGNYHDIAFPITADGRKAIQDVVIAAYNGVDATGKGSATGVVTGGIVINGIKLLEGANGDFVAMPQRQSPDGTYHDIAFPITAEGRKTIADAVVAEYSA